MSYKKSSIAAAVLTAVCAQASAAGLVIVSEVQSAASGSTAMVPNSAHQDDWFELTNISGSTLSLIDWSMDDGSSNWANAVDLRGVTDILPGQSVVFIENSSATQTDAEVDALFRTGWYGSVAAAPSSLVIGFYGAPMTGVSLSSGGDAVNIFNATGGLEASVTFGAAPPALPGGAGEPPNVWRSFDNTAGLNEAAISQASEVGINGAFKSYELKEIGSPGVSAVPLPAAAWLLMSGMGAIGAFARRRRSARS